MDDLMTWKMGRSKVMVLYGHHCGNRGGQIGPAISENPELEA